MKHVKSLFALSSFALLSLASCSSGGGQASTGGNPTCDCGKEECSISESSCPSCPDVHVHEPGTGYVYNEDGHWHACSGCLDKSIRFDYEAHDFEIKNGAHVCKVCSYSPDGDHEELFAKVKAGVKAFLDNKESLTISCDLEAAETSIEGAYASASKGVATFDFENGYAHYKVSHQDEEGKESIDEEKHIGKMGEQYYYYRTRTNGTKTAHKTSEDYINGLYEESSYDFCDAYTLQVIDEISSFSSLITNASFINGFRSDFSTDIYEKDGAVTLEITTSTVEMELGTYSESTQTETFTVKDGFLTGFGYSSSHSYQYAGGESSSEESSIVTAFSKSFDQTLFDSYDVTSAKEDSAAYMYVYVYIGEYRLYGMSTHYGSPFANIESEYGDVYYDQEFTKKYENEPITHYENNLYMKPIETCSSDKAIVFYYSDVTYIKGPELSPKEEKYVEGETLSAGDSYELPWEDESTALGQTITVNGEEVSSEEDKITLEGGKIYTVINSYSVYYGSAD